MAHVTVVGGGGVGTACALGLIKEGHKVTLISKEFAGSLNERCGITTYWAAGIGCVFKPSSPLVGQLVLDSYEAWMTMARDKDTRHVMETDLKIITKPNEYIPYASRVENFNRLDETTAQYRTYSFNPKILLEARLAELRALGAKFEMRSVTADEVKMLKQGVPIANSDYTVEAIGLAARDIHPELDLYPVAGVLIHYIDPDTGELRDSYMNEDKAIYVVTRPSPQGREIILGGTFLEHIGDMSPQDRDVRGNQIIEDVKVQFAPQGFDLSRLDFSPRDITVGYRPAVKGDPVMEQRGRVSITTGLGGQGLVTNPAVEKKICQQVGKGLEQFKGFSLPS